MKNKLEQVNQAYKKALGQVLLRLFPDTVELTVSDVLIDPSYQHGRVWLRTNLETLKAVEAKRSEIQQAVKRYVKTRYLPKLTFIQEDNYLEQIDQLYDQLKTE